MLLDQPLFTAYQSASAPQIRRYLLRLLASQHLHTTPGELLNQLVRIPEVTVLSEPERLASEISLRERFVVQRLTTQDPERRGGGLWTVHSGSSGALDAWRVSSVPAPALANAAGAQLGSIAVELLDRVVDSDRVWVLCALGGMGEDTGLEPLSVELAEGLLPGAAAMGLALMRTEAAGNALLPAVQVRTLENAAPWLGLALQKLASPTTLPLMGRLARAPQPDMREQVAWALGGFGGQDLDPLLRKLLAEPDPFVRLNLLASLQRLVLPEGMELVGKLTKPSDHQLLRMAAVRVAGAYFAGAGRAYLEGALKSDNAMVQAEALETLVTIRGTGPQYIANARLASRSKNSRLQLIGLLALAVWDPGEAFELVRKIFARGTLEEWFLATHVLRYLRTDQTVPLLVQLCEKSANTPLEELAVESLCRHFGVPEALDAVLTVMSRSNSPVVLQRAAEDIAHHLPEDLQGETSEMIRREIARGRPPELGGPLLFTLGALGAEHDLAVLEQHARGEEAPWAVQAMEMLNCQGAKSTLLDLTRDSRPDVQEAALVALYRLGDKQAITRLEEISRSGSPTVASRSLLTMALSARCSKSVSRLSSLYESLANQVPASASPRPAGPTSAARQVRSTGRLQVPVEKAVENQLSDSRAPLIVKEQVVLKQPRQAEMGRTQLIKTMGRNLIAEDQKFGTVPFDLKKVIAGVSVVMVGLFFIVLHNKRNKVDAARESLREDPPLYRTDQGPEKGRVAEGALVDIPTGQPVRLQTRVAEDWVEIGGRFKVKNIRYRPGKVEFCEFRGDLLSGELRLQFPSGQAYIAIQNTRTTVVVDQAMAKVAIVDGLLKISVELGQVRIFRGNIPMKTMKAGETGEFLDGNPLGAGGAK